MTVTEIIQRFKRVTRNRGGWIAECPAHNDHTPSLSISEASDLSTLLHCHAGCSVSEIVRAIGLAEKDLFAGPMIPKYSETVHYDYVDEDGKLLYQVLRKADKTFRQRQPKGGGDWEWSLGDVRRVPYRLPQVLEAIANGEAVIITEGEKDVHTLEHYGYVATCCSGGAQGWKGEFGQYFSGANVILCGDRDIPGQSYLRQVRESLTSAASISKMELPGLYKDITDWHEDRGSKEGIDLMVDILRFLLLRFSSRIQNQQITSHCSIVIVT
jgi:putative DNA primase/helicase